jgi:hypothetical protein
MSSKVNYWVWAGATQNICYEMKSIWGLSTALCILFASSSLVSVFLWDKKRLENKADDNDDSKA